MCYGVGNTKSEIPCSWCSDFLFQVYNHLLSTGNNPEWLVFSWKRSRKKLLNGLLNSREICNWIATVIVVYICFFLET